MFNFVRAAGYAAALLGAAFAPVFADPSQALGLETEASAPSYIDHASANIEADLSQIESAEAQKTLSHDVHFSNEVAGHAVATLADPAAPAAEEAAPRATLASLVDAHDDVGVTDSEMECLAGAIYFESKGEPLNGQLAVAEVIINRMKSGRYRDTICGVVKQPGQFSFIRGGRFPPINRDSADWRKAIAVAHIARNDLADSPVPAALAFHATYVSPRWRMKRLATVGRHVFYR